MFERPVFNALPLQFRLKTARRVIHVNIRHGTAEKKTLLLYEFACASEG